MHLTILIKSHFHEKTPDSVRRFARCHVLPAYNTQLPSQALLKSDFDHRDLSETKAGAMLTAAGIALGAALLLTLILSWKFGWLRRKA